MYIKPITEIKIYNNLYNILLHEYIHFFINQTIKNPPLWFNEGMAVFFSNGISLNNELDFLIQYFSNNDIPLSKMNSYPKQRVEWNYYYLKSAKIIQFMTNGNNKEKFSIFWDLIEVNHNFTYSFRKTYGWSFENAFESRLKNDSILKSIIYLSSLLWGGLPIILILNYFLKKKKNNLIIQKWESESEI